MAALSSGRTIISFMKPLACGLDISDYSAELVALSQTKGRLKIEAASRIELPAGLVRRGVIQQPDKLAALLKVFFHKTLGERRARIALGVSLSENLVYSKVFRLPANLGLDLAAKAAAMSAADVFPLPLNDVASAFAVLSRSKDAQDLYYAVAEAPAVQAYRDVLQRAGLEPLFLEPESLALSRAVIGAGEKEPVLVADIGAATSLLAVHDRGSVVFSSNIASAGNKLTAAIEVKLNVPLEKAENLKRKAGFDPAAETGRVLLILQEPMLELIGEMAKTVDFYARQTGRRIGRVVLAGGSSLTPEIVSYVESNLSGLAVSGGQPLRDIAVDISPKNEDLKTNAILYATAIGLALRAGGFRPAPGLDLRPLGPESGRGAAALFGLARQAGLKLISMVRRKTTKHPKEKAEAKKSAAKTAPAEAPEEIAAAPAAEAPPEEPKIREPAAAEPPPAAEPAAEPEPEDPAADEPPLAHTVSSLLDSTQYETPGSGAAEEPKEENKLDGMPPVTQRGSRVLWVDSIIAGNKTTPPDEVDDADDGAPGKRPRLAVWVLLVLILIAAAAGGVYMFGKKTGLTGASLLSSATSIFQKGADGLRGAVDAGPEAVNAPAAPVAAPTVSQVILVGPEKRPGGTTPSVVSRVVETDVTASGDFSATGTATAKASGVAGGKLTIINKTAESYTFVATTRCLSKEGVLFRLKSATNIPANGSVEAVVYADKPGPSGDIGPTVFTIPGLPQDLQQQIYAESSAPMTGGGSTAKGVAESDLTAAKNALLDKLRTESLADLKAMANANEAVLPELITSQELSVKAPAVGTAGDTFNMKLSVRFRVLLVPQLEVEALLGARLQETLPAGLDPADYEIGDVQYTVEAYDTETDLAEIRVEAPVKKM